MHVVERHRSYKIMGRPDEHAETEQNFERKEMFFLPLSMNIAPHGECVSFFS
jgi:hypothetical protein